MSAQGLDAAVDEAACSSYPCKALWRLEEEGWLNKGEAGRILIERYEGVVNYGLEMEGLLMDTRAQLAEAMKKLRAAELMVALKNIGRAA